MAAKLIDLKGTAVRVENLCSFFIFTMKHIIPCQQQKERFAPVKKVTNIIKAVIALFAPFALLKKNLLMDFFQ